MFENAWRWQDVYCEKVEQSWAEARLRILDPYIVPVIALFQGRVINRPDRAVTETKYSTGGDVEHEIFMIGGTFFIVMELKLNSPDATALAELFLALLSAAKVNMTANFAGLRIYGLLTNLTHFKFYSYDPTTKQFFFDENILVNNTRVCFFSDMIHASNKIFGAIMSGYMEGQHATIKRNQEKANRNDLTRQSDPSSIQAGNDTGNRKSTDLWEAALDLAEHCCAQFRAPVIGLQDIENGANDALELLARSVRTIPRASTFSGRHDDPSTSAELKSLATRVVNTEYARYLNIASKRNCEKQYILCLACLGNKGSWSDDRRVWYGEYSEYPLN